MSKATKYDIEIEGFNSLGIREVAAQCGATHMRFIGGGYANGHDGEADYYVGFYAFPQNTDSTFECRVANTNGDPVWEDEDASVFAELAESVGVDL